MAFQDRLQISRQKLEFFHSIVILVVIPVLVIVLTLVLTTDVRKNFDTELRKKADMASAVLGEAIRYDLEDTEKIQESVSNVSENVDDIEEATVIRNDEGQFTVIASTDEAIVGENVSQDPQVAGAVNNNRSVATLNEDNNGRRTWSVLTPVQNEDLEIIALIGTDVSLVDSDILISSLLQKSLFVLLAIVTVIVILLLNHFKFVEYAMLFRKLKEVDQLKSDFLSVATHELKSPMAVIKGYLENILDGVVGHVDNDARKSLEAAHAETDRLGNLVTDLLNVSRIEQGKVNYNKEHVIVSEVVEDVVGRYKRKAEEKNLKLNYDKPTQQLVVNVDRGRLIEITTNLVDNAIKYSREGTVQVRATVEGKNVKIHVKDTGIGMSAKEREHLFNRFYRIKNDKTKNISGTGLGLWIIKQYIEAMDGHIYVESLEGVGSEFIVEFPLVDKKEVMPEKSR